MADKSEDIEKLIELQKQRPAFSRIISWEISQASQYKPVKRRKQRKKRTGISADPCEERREEENQSADDTETISDDSSEYETACEDEEEIEVRGQIGSEGQCDSINSDILDYLSNCEIDTDDEDDEQDVDELLMSCVGNNTLELGRRRRRSKKQKRKQRDEFKDYLNGLYNLGNLFDTTDEINDVFTDVLAEGPDIEIQHRVPTLVELCLKVNRRKQRKNLEKGKNSRKSSKQQTVVLPYGMKKLISYWGWSQKQLKNQLSFLLNKVLPEVEHKMERKEHVEHIKTEANKNPNLFFPKRSVWSNLPYAPSDAMFIGEYGSEKSTCFLFTPSAHFHRNILRFGNRYESYYEFDNLTLNNAMWVLGTTIDLMLPSERDTASTTRSISRVKRALNLRYKTLVNVLFENTVPYVMWMRGKIAMATDMFRNLIEKETEVDTKAMYLSEIARMHAIFGDSKTAEQFYRVATETALEECNAGRRDKCINEATEQKQILLASIYDTGVLDEEKAAQSFMHWTGVKNIPTVRTATLIAGLDALLCYHLSQLPGPNLYDEAIAKLDKVTNECEYAYYYQSMLHALNGSSDMSTRLYRKSIICCSMTPGAAVLPYITHRDRNPWQPLIDHLNGQTLKVKPLQVIWRTNLQPARITTHRAMEGQLNSAELNLRMNEAGHVTGDIQMMMPPLRDISLNPYTGFLMIQNQPSRTAIWTSACLDKNYYHFYDFLVPTYRLIYSGDDGTSVHLAKSSNSKTSLKFRNYSYSSGPPCPFILNWRSPNGSVAKLNVHALLRNKVKEDVAKSIEARKDEYTKTGSWKFSKTMYMKLFEFMEMALEKDIAITELLISSAVASYNRDLKKAAKLADIAKNKKGKKKCNLEIPEKPFSSYLDINSYTIYFNWKIINEPYIFGKTAILLVKGTDKHVFCVVVNTENKDTFLSSKVLILKQERILSQQFRNNYTDEDFFMTASASEIQVMNKIGNTVVTLRNSDIAKAAREGASPVIIYPKIFGVSMRKSIWSVQLGEEKENEIIDEFADKICWTIDLVYEQLSNNSAYIQGLTYIGKNNSHIGKLLMANLLTGLAFIHPNTMEYVPINIKEGCAKHFEFTKDQYAMKGNFEDVKILTEKVFTVSDVTVYRVAIGVENKVFVLEINNEHDNSTIHLEMICCIVLPGLPKEVCLVGRKVGLLISFTQHNDKLDEYYREHMFHFDYDGQLHGALLCLSHGPRSFLPVYLHGNTENEGQGDVASQGGWHVYLRDGRDGIMCICLH